MKTIKKNPSVLLFLWMVCVSLACQSIGFAIPTKTLIPTETPVPRKTISVPTQTLLPPTPTVEMPNYSGFSKMELLPNDILQTSAALPSAAGLNENLMRPFAGGRGPCIKNPGDPALKGVYLEYPLIFLCEGDFYSDDESKSVEISLKKPDGDTDTFTQQVISGERHCLDSRRTLLPGKYMFDISSSGYKNKGNFLIKDDVPRILVGGAGTYQFLQKMCATKLTNGDAVEIFFVGFAPSQLVKVLFYTSSEINDYRYKTFWTAEMDENGYLVQYIPAASFPEGTEFVFIVNNLNAHPAPDERMMMLMKNPDWVYTAIMLSK